MKKIDKMKKVLRIIMLLLLIAIVIYAAITILPNRNKKPQGEETDKVDIYALYKRDTELYKEVFNSLKEELNGNKDYEKYAEYISKLFIIDLYTLSNKDNMEDVGGIQYVYESARDNFKLNASNTMYKYINDIEKPTVKSIELVSIEPTTYTLNKKEYNGYLVSLKWDYEKDLEYDKEGNVIVIKDNDRLYVVEKNNGN